MKQIPLGHRDWVALVDDDDYEAVSRYKWHALHTSRGFYYAARKRHKDEEGLDRWVMMHRSIMGLGVYDQLTQVDHADHNTLNNQRSNLRTCTHRENMVNRSGWHKKGTPHPSPFKGVSWDGYRPRKPWKAQITISGKQRRIGRYATQEDAARAYDEMAIKHHGDFARVNFPAEADDVQRKVVN